MIKIIDLGEVWLPDVFIDMVENHRKNILEHFKGSVDDYRTLLKADFAFYFSDYMFKICSKLREDYMKLLFDNIDNALTYVDMSISRCESLMHDDVIAEDYDDLGSHTGLMNELLSVRDYLSDAIIICKQNKDIN